jgi:hypothetical protein
MPTTRCPIVRGLDHFDSDKNQYVAKDKSEKRKADRKNEKRLIKKELESEQ